MKNYEITKAKPVDIIAINEITNYAIINSDYNLNTQTKTIKDTSDWFNYHINNGYPIITANIDGYVVGWASLSKFRQFNGYNKTAEISVYVRDGYYRMGIGENMLKVLEEEARERGFHSLIAVITATNQPSINLHKKLNFEQSGTFKEIAFKNNKFLDVVFMSKILK